MIDKFQEFKFNINNIKELQILFDLMIKQYKHINIYFFRKDSLSEFNNIKRVVLKLGEKVEMKSYFGNYIELGLYYENNLIGNINLSKNSSLNFMINIEENKIAIY